MDEGIRALLPHQKQLPTSRIWASSLLISSAAPSPLNIRHRMGANKHTNQALSRLSKQTSRRAAPAGLLPTPADQAEAHKTGNHPPPAVAGSAAMEDGVLRRRLRTWAPHLQGQRLTLPGPLLSFCRLKTQGLPGCHTWGHDDPSNPSMVLSGIYQPDPPPPPCPLPAPGPPWATVSPSCCPSF